MAVNPETSLVRARLRFEEQVSEVGTGRLVNQEQHSTAYRGVASTVAVLEHEKLVGKVTLYDAHQRPVYENQTSRTDERVRWGSCTQQGVQLHWAGVVLAHELEEIFLELSRVRMGQTIGPLDIPRCDGSQHLIVLISQ